MFDFRPRRLAATSLLLSVACATSTPPESTSPSSAPLSGANGSRTEPVPDAAVASGLDEYRSHAADAHPGLAAARESWQAQTERIPQVGTLPDPQLTYRYFLEEVETRVGPQIQAVGVKQRFPWFGTLGTREDIARAAADAAGARYQGKHDALLAELTEAWAELYYLGRATLMVTESCELVRHLEEVALARYESGAAEHSEVIRAQVERDRIEDRLRSLVDRRGPMVARLGTLIGDADLAELDWPESLPEVELDVDPPRLAIWLEESNPELLALRHEIERGDAGVRLAERDGYPDFTLGLDWIDVGAARMAGVPDSGKDAWSVSLGLDIPLQRGRYAAADREARAHHRAAALALEQKQNELREQLSATLWFLRDAKEKRALYRDSLVPRSQQSLEVIEMEFHSGGSSFGDLIEARRALLEYELLGERAQADCAIQLARLERLVGRPIPVRATTMNGHENEDRNSLEEGQ